MLNIGGQSNDESYRYKMPPIKSKKEGRGNGIKTAIDNIVDISKCLNIDPIYPTKYFGIELCAHSSFNKKTGRSVVNGYYDNDKMQKTLFNFIEKFILCDSCHLPEVVILVDKKRAKVAKKCASCGIKIKVDPLHKLTSFIAKKPPSYKKSHLRKKPETHKQSQPEKQTIAQKQNDDSDWDDDIDSEDGLKNDDERDAAPAKFYKNSLTENEENTSILEDMLSENASVDQLMAEVGRMELASPSGKILGKLVILQGVIQAMFGGAPKESNRSVLATIEKQRDFLSELMAADERNPANFLVALEDLVRNKRSDLLKGLPMFLEKLYDLEILGEEEMIKWFENVEDDDKVSLSCGVFVDWLKEAETEESG